MNTDDEDLDSIIEGLSNELEEKQIQELKTQETTKEVSIVTERTEDELVNLAIQKSEEIEVLADKAFNLFYAGLKNGTDHTSASKEQMLEALKVRTELNKSVVELAKLKRKQQTGVGVLINTINPSQVGIDMSRLRDAVNEDMF